MRISDTADLLLVSRLELYDYLLGDVAFEAVNGWRIIRHLDAGGLAH
jgi:hypothetical protein